MAIIAKIHARKQAHINEQRRLVQKHYEAMFVALGRRDGFCCQQCSSSNKNLQIDHIVPVSAGGGSEMNNLQLLCQQCNASKGAKLPVAPSATQVVSQPTPIHHPPSSILDYHPVRRLRDELFAIKRVSEVLLWCLLVISSEITIFAYYIHSGTNRDLDIRDAAWIATGAVILTIVCLLTSFFTLLVRYIIRRYYGPPQHQNYIYPINDFVTTLANASLKDDKSDFMNLSDVCLIILCARDQNEFERLRIGMHLWAEKVLKTGPID